MCKSYSPVTIFQERESTRVFFSQEMHPLLILIGRYVCLVGKYLNHIQLPLASILARIYHLYVAYVFNYLSL
jgi:hypothetical protein